MQHAMPYAAYAEIFRREHPQGPKPVGSGLSSFSDLGTSTTTAPTSSQPRRDTQATAHYVTHRNSALGWEQTNGEAAMRTRSEVQHELLELAHYAKRQTPGLGSPEYPSRWDTAHAYIDALLDEWDTTSN